MKSVAILVAALAGLAVAAPAPDVAAPSPTPQANPPATAARDVRLRFFTKDHFEGRETNDEAEFGQCGNVPRNANDKVRSIKIDSDRARCTFYNDKSCRGENFSPRRGTDVPVMDDEFKLEISSYLCTERRRDGNGGSNNDRDKDRDRDGDRDRDRGDRDRGDRDRDRGGRP